MDTTTTEGPATANGIDEHLPDADQSAWTRDGSPNTPERYGVGLAATLEQAGERLTDPEGVSRSTSPEPELTGGSAGKRPKRYRAGSKYLDVDSAIGNSAIDALWSGPGSIDRSRRVGLVKGTFEAIKPRDEVEGLLGAQLIACAGAAMESFRRAAIPNQPAPVLTECLNQGNRASRTFAVLLEALDRHRGKGSQQRVEVRHVHVHAGGQAVVGVVGRGHGRGGKSQKSRQSHAERAALAHAPEPALRCQDEGRQPVPIAGDGERPLPDARRHQSGRTDG